MKRWCIYNSLVALAFTVLCSALVAIEVRVGLFRSESYLFFGSMPLVFFAVFIGSKRALSDKPEKKMKIALLSSAVVSPIIIVAGAVVATNLKLLIGGSL